MAQAQFSRLGSMARPDRSARAGGRGDDSLAAVRAFEEECRRGVAPPVHRVWADRGADESLAVLSGLIKAELKARFERGERPTAAEYLDRFPRLRDDGERVLSLVYEEFCLLEERGEQPSPESFCDRYPDWRHSLASQLQYHRQFSQVVAPPPRPTFPEPGAWFVGEFQLRALLGSGGAGRVYRAYQPECHREVALKVSADHGRDSEPSLLGRLDHPHIVPILSVHEDEDAGLRGLCMPYHAGLPLDEVLHRLAPGPGPGPRDARSLLLAVLPTAAEGGDLPAGWRGFPAGRAFARGVAWLGATLAQALAHAHERGVYHRDVKPANVLLTALKGPLLLDFNLAHASTGVEDAEAARSGGTLPYMAPEQLRAFLDPGRWPDVGPAADIYALGLVLRELLTGDRPEAPDRSLALPRAVQEMLDRRALPASSLRALNPGVPHALDAVVTRCLAFDPAARYPDAAALAEDLQRVADHRPPRHVANPSRREVAGDWLRRNRLRIGGAVLLATFATGVYAASEMRSLPRKEAIRHVDRGKDRLSAGDLISARGHFTEAIRHDDRNYAAYHGLGAVELQAGRYPDAERLLTESLARIAGTSPRVPDGRVSDVYRERALCRLKWARKDQERADRMVSPGQRDERDALFALSESRLREALGDLERARPLNASGRLLGPLAGRAEFATKAAALEVTAAVAHVYMADACAGRGDGHGREAQLHAALDRLDEVRRVHPGDAEAERIRYAVLKALGTTAP